MITTCKKENGFTCHETSANDANSKWSTFFENDSGSNSRQLDSQNFSPVMKIPRYRGNDDSDDDQEDENEVYDSSDVTPIVQGSGQKRKPSDRLSKR